MDVGAQIKLLGFLIDGESQMWVIPVLVCLLLLPRGRPAPAPRIAVVNSQPFHLEILAGLVDATSAFRASTTYYIDPAVFPRGGRNLGFIPWIQDVNCELKIFTSIHGTSDIFDT